MSQNLRLVEYFSSAFYFDQTVALGHIASTTFSFSINSGPLMDFEGYIKRREILSQNATLEIDTFNSIDDIHFYANFIVKLKNGKSYGGQSMLMVSRGLLEEVKLTYNLSSEELEEFQRLLTGENSIEL